jgi:molybdopterin-guanine dinucleotide biosynthesis protein A
MTRRAVVLAGGDSRRFGGRDKALARVSGEPMLRLVSQAAAEVTDAPPVVAVRTAERAQTYSGMLETAEFVTDAPQPNGPIGGVEAALDHTTADWLFVCGCDMPHLAPSAIDWLFDHRGPAPAVVPRSGDWYHPLHAWYSPTRWQPTCSDSRGSATPCPRRGSLPSTPRRTTSRSPHRSGT